MLRRLLILMTAFVLFAGACGGDSDDAAADTDTSGSDSSDDSGSDDSGSDDSGSDDSGSDDSGSDTPSLFNCDDVRDALERAGNSVDLDPSAGADDLEASFNESRAQLEALAQEAPELADDVADALAGMDAIGEALAALDWNTDNMAADPEAALEFASLISDPAVMGMTQALSNISAWVASSCA